MGLWLSRGKPRPKLKEELNKITKNDFLKCFEDSKKPWHKCIISGGDYIDGNKIDIYEEINNF